MARWETIGRSYHNMKWDLLTVRVHYKTRSIENDYLIGKDEKRVPRELLEERKWGDSRSLDRKKWVEGNVKKVRR